MPVIVKCAWCKKEFSSSIRKGKTQKYCSKPCYWKAWEGEHPELYKLSNRICERCGKEFHPRDKDHGKRFCSRECLLAWRAKQRKVKCVICGKDFLRDNSDEKFCSQECFHKFNVGSNQTQFTEWLTHDERGYLRFTKGHPRHADKYVHQVVWLEAHPDAKCMKCGGMVGVVHHKDGDKSNNELSNLIGLCNNCHAKLHHPKGRRFGS